MALNVNQFGKVRYAAETSAQVQHWMNRNLQFFAGAAPLLRRRVLDEDFWQDKLDAQFTRNGDPNFPRSFHYLGNRGNSGYPGIICASLGQNIGEPAAFINMLFQRLDGGFLNLTSEMQSMLVPLVKIDVPSSNGQRLLNLPLDVQVGAIENAIPTATNDFHVKQPGFMSFEWTDQGNMPGVTGLMFGAKLNMYFNSVDALVNTYHGPDGAVSFLQLLSPSHSTSTECVITVGWNKPSISVTDPRYAELQEIALSQRACYSMYITGYDLTLTDSGAVELEINFQLATENLFHGHALDILEPNPERGYESQRAIDLRERQNALEAEIQAQVSLAANFQALVDLHDELYQEIAGEDASIQVYYGQDLDWGTYETTGDPHGGASVTSNLSLTIEDGGRGYRNRSIRLQDAAATVDAAGNLSSYTRVLGESNAVHDDYFIDWTMYTDYTGASWYGGDPDSPNMNARLVADNYFSFISRWSEKKLNDALERDVRTQNEIGALLLELQAADYDVSALPFTHTPPEAGSTSGQHIVSFNFSYSVQKSWGSTYSGQLSNMADPNDTRTEGRSIFRTRYFVTPGRLLHFENSRIAAGASYHHPAMKSGAEALAAAAESTTETASDPIAFSTTEEGNQSSLAALREELEILRNQRIITDLNDAFSTITSQLMKRCAIMKFDVDKNAIINDQEVNEDQEWYDDMLSSYMFIHEDSYDPMSTGRGRAGVIRTTRGADVDDLVYQYAGSEFEEDIFQYGAGRLTEASNAVESEEASDIYLEFMEQMDDRLNSGAIKNSIIPEGSYYSDGGLSTGNTYESVTENKVRCHYFYLGDLLGVVYNHFFPQIKVIVGPMVTGYVEATDNPGDGYYIGVSMADIPINFYKFNRACVSVIGTAWARQGTLPPHVFIEHILQECLINFDGVPFGQAIENPANNLAQTHGPGGTVEVSQQMVTVSRPEESPDFMGGISLYGQRYSLQRLFDWLEPTIGDPRHSENWYCIYAQNNPSRQLRAEPDEEVDRQLGIFHLKHAAEKGIVKTINYTKSEAPMYGEGVMAAQIDQGGTQGPTPIAYLYNAEVTMYGNVLFENGMRVYIDPRLPRSGIDAQARGRLGISGYYRVVKTNHVIEDGKYETVIKCVLETAYTGDASNNPQDAQAGLSGADIDQLEANEGQ